MTRIDFSPLYRSSVGFDRLASLVNDAAELNQGANGYPPYNIESLGENQYSITVAVAGFDESDIEIVTERGVLMVRGTKETQADKPNYLYQGIGTRNFERKFQLADFIEVKGAQLNNGLLTVSLAKEVPEALKPQRIAINGRLPESAESVKTGEIKAA